MVRLWSHQWNETGSNSTSDVSATNSNSSFIGLNLHLKTDSNNTEKQKPIIR